MLRSFIVLSASLIMTVSYASKAEECLANIDNHIEGDKKQHLNFEDCHISDNDIPIVTVFLANHREITSASFENHDHIRAYPDISAKGAKELSNVTGLKYLNFSGNKIGDEGLAAFANYPTLKGLSADYCRITDKGIIELAKNKSIDFLSVSYNDIGNQGAAAIATMPALKDLFISWNRISNPGTQALAKSNSITSLALANNYISDAGAAAFQFNNKLLDLFLDDNRISSKGMISLAKNKTIKFLTVPNNLIDDEGAEALANNQIIDVINLTNNRITERGAKYLAKNSALIYLLLAKNKIGDQGAQAFSNHPTLEMLHLDDCGISDAGASTLNLPHLEFLGLSNNEITDAGAIALSNSNPKLHWLDVSFNHIGKTGLDQLHHSHIRSILDWEQDMTFKLLANNIQKTALHEVKIKEFCSKFNLSSANPYTLKRSEILNMKHKKQLLICNSLMG